MKKVLSMTLIVVLLLVTVVGCSQQTEQTTGQTSTEKVPGVTADTITIGAIGDFTGPQVATSAPKIQAMNDYAKWINDKGGINGRKIVIKWEDDAWKTDKAIAAFRKLNDEGIFALVGQAGSTQWTGLDPEIRAAKIPVIGPSQTTKMQSDNPYTYNTMLSYDIQGPLLVQRAVSDFKGPGKPKIAILAPEGASSLEFENAIKAEAAKEGATVVDSERVSYSVSDMAGPVTKIKQAGGDAVIWLANVTMMNLYLRDAARLGLNAKVYMAYPTVDPVVWETAGPEAAKNVVGLHPWSPIYEKGAGLEEMRQAAAKYNTPADITNSMNYINGWVPMMVFTEALKRAGKDVTRENFLKALESIQNFDTGGISGPISYGPGNHNGSSYGRFYSYDFSKKQLVPVSDWETIKK